METRALTEIEAQRIRDEERVADAVRVSLHAAAAARRPGPLPDPRAPYFARMRVRIGGRRRDILLGARTYADASRDVRIIDWRTAPLARVFFAYHPGEEFAEDLGERELCGQLEQQSLVTFVDGHLVGMTTAEHAYHREPSGQWIAAPAPIPDLDAPELLAPIAAPGASPLARLMGLLDGEQRAVVDDLDTAPVLISGSAGTGKTTTALLRLGTWRARAGNQGRKRRALVIVPERGLARAVGARLEHFDITGVAVETFDDWVTTQARRLFHKQPPRTCTDSPPGVGTLKRHPALHALLPRFVAQLGDEMAARIDHALLARGQAAACVQACQGPNLLATLRQVEVMLADRGIAEQREVAAVLARERRRLYDLDADRLAFLGDRMWLDAAVEAAGGELTAYMVEAAIAHTRVQLATTTERAHAHVDRERLQTVDSRPIDEGTGSEHASTIDVEDYAIMLELLRLKTGAIETPRGRLDTYHHLVIDEAQELTAVELAVLAATRRDDTVMSLAGDAAQQVGENTRFRGWDQVLAQAGLGDARQVPLQHTYRCPQPIALLAHQVLGPLAPPEPPEIPRQGPPVRVSEFPNTAHRAFGLARALMDLGDRAPDARVAVITSTPESARDLHRVLHDCCGARLVENGEFLFAPGIDVTDVAQIKGLEFDVVIVPDASAAAYPDTSLARRRLHVALTRSSHTLWITAVGAITPLLAGPAQGFGSDGDAPQA